MKYKAIIFDLDGTVIDTEHIWRDATYEIIRRRGIIITPEIQHTLAPIMAGVGLKKGCEKLIEIFSLSDTIEAMAHEKNTLVLSMLKDRLTLMEGFIRFHAKIKELNLPIALATNADEHTLALVQEKLKIGEFFGEHIYYAKLVGKYKPDPAVYLHAAEKLGFKPEECIAIEDSKHGIRAALNAKMFCIGLNSAKKIEHVQDAHHIVHHYDEIDLEKLLEIPVPVKK